MTTSSASWAERATTVTTTPDTYGLPEPGVTMSSGDLTVSSMDVPLSDPFNGDCLELQVTKPVNLAQLTTEIQRRTKTPVMLALRSNPTDAPPTAATPNVLWVKPGSLNEKTVASVVAKHVPVPEVMESGPEIIASNTATAITPAFDANQQSLVDRLQAGEQLNAAESSDLLRAILGISS